MSVFIDTGAFLAYRNIKDRHHTTANKLFLDALKGKYGQMYTSDYVYNEALTLALAKTNNMDAATDVAKVILSPRIRMIFVDAGLMERATRAFKKYAGKELSFTDAVSIEIMNELEIEKYFGFDDRFKGIAGRLDDRIIA